jgi:glycosyltransferase involved in cell wall biosynthesis
MLELSVIMPVYNEAENLPILWDELRTVLANVGRTVEIIFVDDGSTDASAAIVREFARQDPRARLIRFAANAGLTAALFVGFRAATGRIVVTLDSDLQNDPADIKILLDHLERADAAVGWRRRRNDPWSKRLSSRIANAVRTAVLGDTVSDSACTLRAMRRECCDVLVPYDGMHRFVPTLLRQAGYRVVEVEVNHRPRQHGQSKFGIRDRAGRAFADLLAVKWLTSRRLRYTIAEDLGGDTFEEPPDESGERSRPGRRSSR